MRIELFHTLAGAALGLIVWRFDAPASLALLLPVIWLNAGSRLAGAGAVIGYYLAGAFDVIDAARMFFGQSTFIGVAVWVGQAVLLSLPWLMLWSPTYGPDRAWRVVLVLVATAVPPFGLFNWLSPLLAAGELFPSAGLLGLPATILLTVLLSTWKQRNPILRTRALSAGAAVAVAFQIGAAMYPGSGPPTGWVGINTTMGVLPPNDKAAQYRRAQDVVQAIAGTGASSVSILPEGIIGRWRPAAQYWLSAGNISGMILAGADVAAPEGGYRNAVLDIRTGAIVATARIPMPISLWRPWLPAESALAAPWGAGLTRIAGHQVAVSVCYEDFLLWPQLLSLSQYPEVLISVANNWFVRPGSHASVIQRRSIDLTAKLFKVPMVRAVNMMND